MGHNRWLEKLAREIVSGKVKSVEPWYLLPLEKVEPFFWAWRASDKKLTPGGAWEETDERFWSTVYRLDRNLEYWIQKVRDEKKPQADQNNPDDLIDFMTN